MQPTGVADEGEPGSGDQDLTYGVQAIGVRLKFPSRSDIYGRVLHRQDACLGVCRRRKLSLKKVFGHFRQDPTIPGRILLKPLDISLGRGGDLPISLGDRDERNVRMDSILEVYDHEPLVRVVVNRYLICILGNKLKEPPGMEDQIGLEPRGLLGSEKANYDLEIVKLRGRLFNEVILARDETAEKARKDEIHDRGPEMFSLFLQPKSDAEALVNLIEGTGPINFMELLGIDPAIMVEKRVGM